MRPIAVFSPFAEIALAMAGMVTMRPIDEREPPPPERHPPPDRTSGSTDPNVVLRLDDRYSGPRLEEMPKAPARWPMTDPRPPRTMEEMLDEMEANALRRSRRPRASRWQPGNTIQKASDRGTEIKRELERAADETKLRTAEAKRARRAARRGRQ